MKKNIRINVDLNLNTESNVNTKSLVGCKSIPKNNNSKCYNEISTNTLATKSIKNVKGTNVGTLNDISFCTCQDEKSIIEQQISISSNNNGNRLDSFVGVSKNDRNKGELL